MHTALCFFAEIYFCILLTTRWVCLFHVPFVKNSPFIQPSNKLINKYPSLPTVGQNEKISDESLSLPFYWQPICLLLDLRSRGFWSCQRVSVSPGEIEEKKKTEHLSRWCALTLAQNQIQTLIQPDTHQGGGLDILYKYTYRCLFALFLWRVILNRLCLLSTDT